MKGGSWGVGLNIGCGSYGKICLNSCLFKNCNLNVVWCPNFMPCGMVCVGLEQTAPVYQRRAVDG